MRGQLAFPEEHFHLAWYGHSVCHDPGCTRERDDPANDMPCTCPPDATADGLCAGGKYNRGRRAHLVP
jgi:hypothetical protein